MKVRIKRVDSAIPLPEYKTAGAAGFDLSSRKMVEIAPKTLQFVPLNVIVELPPGHMMLLAARSSLPKKGLMLANGVGIGDADFCGPEDEYQALLYNYSENPAIVEKGERIAQGIIMKVEHAELDEVEEMNSPTRGGVGSTGKF